MIFIERAQVSRTGGWRYIPPRSDGRRHFGARLADHGSARASIGGVDRAIRRRWRTQMLAAMSKGACTGCLLISRTKSDADDDRDRHAFVAISGHAGRRPSDGRRETLFCCKTCPRMGCATRITGTTARRSCTTCWARTGMRGTGRCGARVDRNAMPRGLRPELGPGRSHARCLERTRRSDRHDRLLDIDAGNLLSLFADLRRRPRRSRIRTRGHRSEFGGFDHLAGSGYARGSHAKRWFTGNACAE